MGGFSLYFLTLVPHAATHRVRSPQPSAQRTALLTGGKTHALRLITWPPTTAFTTTAASLPLTHCPCCRHHRQPQPFRPRPCSCTCCRVLLAVKCARTSDSVLTRICTLNGTVKESELLHWYHCYNVCSQRGSEDPLCPYTTSAPSASSERPGAGSCQISTITRPDIATFTLGARASTNRNIAREDVVQKHHQTAARCRRLLAGEPRHPWFVTNT